MIEKAVEPTAVLGTPADLRWLGPLHLIGQMCVNREAGQGTEPDHVQGGDAQNSASVPWYQTKSERQEFSMK